MNMLENSINIHENIEIIEFMGIGAYKSTGNELTRSVWIGYYGLPIVPIVELPSNLMIDASCLIPAITAGIEELSRLSRKYVNFNTILEELCCFRNTCSKFGTSKCSTLQLLQNCDSLSQFCNILTNTVEAYDLGLVKKTNNRKLTRNFCNQIRFKQLIGLRLYQLLKD